MNQIVNMASPLIRIRNIRAFRSARFFSSGFLLLLLSVPCLHCFGQASQDNQPLFLKFPTIPQFSVIRQDGSAFTNEDFRKNQPILIFLFSPDCEHCQHETRQIQKNISRFRGTQILMVSPFGMPSMQSFYKTYQIAKYPEITMSNDPKRWLFTFFLLHNFPGLYVYNKKKQLLFHTEGTTPVDTLLRYLNP